MTFEALKVSLDENCFLDFVRRYHFNNTEINQINKIYRQVAPRVHAQFHHVLEDTDLGKRALVVLTLGQAFDEFQESLSAKGDIHNAYIVDCIGLELMSRAYEEIDKKIYEFTGLFPGDYRFAGSGDMPLSSIPELMAKLGQNQVTCNDSYVLIPKKSVIFYTDLFTEKQTKHSSCHSCSAVNCPMRKQESLN